MVHIDLSKASTASSIQPYFVNNRIWLLPTKLFCGLEFTVRTSYYSSWDTLGLSSWPDTYMNDLTEVVKFSNFESYVDKTVKTANKNLHFPMLAA